MQELDDRPLNRLGTETSPYLLQHARNPVDWRPWGDEAWQAARDQDKPVLVSIGYAACHWCHVMERESFEDPAIAKLQNDLVISIKVDREERPDVDEIYMDAVQMMHGHGGWPLNMFCTPDGEPFFGGTYFPPRGRTGMPGWPDVLNGVARAWREQRAQVREQASQLARHLDLQVELAAEESSETPAELRARAVRALLQSKDARNGGFGGAPKFPQPAYLQLLLAHALDESAADASAAREHLALTLRKMAASGIHDQLAGGFHRYAVDAIWLVPHFEKMLYDNALLIPLYLAACRLTGDPSFARTAERTADYLLEGLQAPDGAFFASTDADSEGEEGKYFVWTRDELFSLLDEADAEAAARVWGVDLAGNFEGKTILQLSQPPADAARFLGRSAEEVEASLERARAALLAERAVRVPPATDTKIITAWNGMAISALAQAGAALDAPRFTDAAARAADFILANCCTDDGRLLRIHSAGKASVPAFIEDYAALADGLLSLYEATADERWFAGARALIDDACRLFWDDEHGAFFTVASDGEQLVAKRKPAQDGATPSGNALAARALARLYALTADGSYADRIEAMRAAFSAYLSKAPTMMGDFVSVLDWLPVHRAVALVGDPADPRLQAMRRLVLDGPPLPAVLMQRDPAAPTEIPQLADKPIHDRPAAYVCRGMACSAPVFSPEDFAGLLQEGAIP